MSESWLNEPTIDVDAQWAGVQRRRALRRRRRRAATVVTASGIAVVTLLVAGSVIRGWTRGQGPAPDDSAPSAAGADPAPGESPEATPGLEPGPDARPEPASTNPVPEPTHFRLADGSTVVPRPGARVHVCEDAGTDGCFVVERGSVEFFVEPRADAPFEVHAGRVTVRVVGTQFVVTHEDEGDRERIEVAVQSGQVDVSAGPGERHRLGPGDEWRLTERHGQPAEATAPRPAVATGPSPADRLWTEARNERRAGDERAAAEVYVRFLAEHPRDPRTGLAALELGRLRMDALDDPEGAVASFERALASRTASEDALARLVRVLDELGRTAECAARKREYAETFPSGVHGPSLETLCTDGG